MSKKNKQNIKNKIEPINKNKALLKSKIKTMIKNGRAEITSMEELSEFPPGSIISYMNTNGIYRSGGFLIKSTDDYFVYLKLDISQKIRVRVRCVDKIWIGNVHNITNDIISLVPTNKPKTSNPVKIGKNIIYYAKDKYDHNRFLCTQKYQIMIKWYNIFGK